MTQLEITAHTLLKKRPRPERSAGSRWQFAARTLAEYSALLLQPASWRFIARRLDTHFVEMREWRKLPPPGPGCDIHASTSFRCAENVFFMGDNGVRPGCFFWASPNSRIILEPGAGCAPGVMIFSSNHGHRGNDFYWRDEPFQEGLVTIGRNTHLAAGVKVILNGKTGSTTIGDNCIVATGAVVRSDIPPGSIAAGVPARVVGRVGEP